MRKYLTAFFLCLLHSTYTEAMSLSQTIQYGLRHSPVIKEVDIKSQSSQLDVDIARSSFYPTLDLQSKHGTLQVEPAEKDKNYLSEFSIIFSQSLFNNFKDYHYLQAQKSADNEQKQQQQETISLFIRDLHEKIFKYSTSKQLLMNAIEKHELITHQFKLLEKSYKSGFKPQTDYLRFKSQFQRSQINLANLAMEVESILDTIKSMIGYQEQDKIEIEALTPDFTKLPNSQFEPVKIEDHYLIRRASYNIAKHQSLAEIAKKNDQIDVQLNIEGKYGAQDYWGYEHRNIGDIDRTAWTAYLMINYNIFDAQKGADLFQKSINDRLISEERRLNTQLDLQKEINNLQRSLILHKKTAKLNLDLYQLEKENFALLQTQYQQGQANILELTTAVENLESAKNAYTEAYFQLLTDIAHLWHHNRKFTSTNFLLEM